MIATRQRKKKRNLKPLLCGLGALALLVGANAWPPAHDAIATGPLKPAFDVLGVVARPLTFAGQQQTITDRNRTIRDLNAQLEGERQQKVADEARIQQLQQQLGAASAAPKPTAVPQAIRTAAPAAGLVSAPAPGGSAAPVPSDDEKRVAATWAAMEPEKAAAVIRRLPDDEVVRVLAAMDADSAAAILGALPPAVAARLSRPGAQVSAPSGR